MLLSDIIEYLGYGELHSMFIAGDDSGKIKPKDYPRLISIINMGMLDLHKKFPILYKQVNVQMYEHITDYVIEKYYAISNTGSTATYKYIVDSANKPFNNDIIKITRIINEDCCEYPLNDTDNPLSLFTTAYNTVQIPYPLKENIVGIEYQAYPEKIPVDTVDLENYYVEFPEFLLEALSAYVNTRIFSGIGVEKQVSSHYLQKYELECSRILQLGLYNLDMGTNLKLENTGWV